MFGSLGSAPEDGTIISTLTCFKIEFHCATVGVCVCVCATFSAFADNNRSFWEDVTWKESIYESGGSFIS